MSFTTPIDEQLFSHIESQLTGWNLQYDVFHDETGKIFIIRSAGGVQDGHLGESDFDLIAISDSQNSGPPKTLLNTVSGYLLTNYKFGDIINSRILSEARLTGLLSNDRPAYTMTIRLTTNRTESP